MITVGQDDEREDQGAGKEHAADADPAHDEGETEDAVDDRRDRSEVLDVDLEEPVVPPLLSRVLLEVDRRPDPDRNREEEDENGDVQRRQDRGARTCLLGDATTAGS